MLLVSGMVVLPVCRATCSALLASLACWERRPVVFSEWAKARIASRHRGGLGGGAHLRYRCRLRLGLLGLTAANCFRIWG